LSANKVKRHIKPGKISKEGGIISIEKPIDASNVMFFDSKSGKAVKTGVKIIDGKKYRLNNETGDVL
jgi:large subunit ribosomal protein L24